LLDGGRACEPVDEEEVRVEDPRPEKVAVVAEVRERLSSASAALLTEYRGLDVHSIGELRRALRAAGGDYKIYKNSLVRFAVRELGLDLEDLLIGPTAIAFVLDRKPDGSPADAVDVAKALRDFARGNPALVVKGGMLGDRLLAATDARALADVDPRDVLLARFAGGMAAPLRQLASLLQALPVNFAYGLKALIDQQGGVPEPPTEPSEGEPVSDAAEAPAEAAAETQGDAEGGAADGGASDTAGSGADGAAEGAVD
jgi:large subunit ribosomal protein L10